jgi:hypothetical protein
MTSTYIIGAGQTTCGRFLDATVASLAIEANAGGFVEGDNAVGAITILERKP